MALPRLQEVIDLKCKSCSRSIDNDSIYCKWCGTKQLRERKKKDVIKVPKPRQLKSGSWNIQLREEGQSVTEATAALCTAKATAIRAGFLEAKKAAPKITVKTVLQRYIDRRELRSPSTLHGYETIMNTRFKDIANDDINAVDWQAVINREAERVSAKTLKNAWGFAHAAMVDAGITPPKIVLPQAVKKDTPWLDYEQIGVFLDAIRGTSGELGALLALHSLRRSEILAVTVGKIDRENNVIRVEGAVVRGKNGMVEKETNKTSASRREVPIMIPRLLELIPDAPPDTKLITYKANSLYDKINRVCRKADLPEVGVHGLRRSFASLAYHLKWDIMTTMRIGGWDDDKVVREIYTKLSAKDVDKDIKKMRRFYKKY